MSSLYKSSWGAEFWRGSSLFTAKIDWSDSMYSEIFSVISDGSDKNWNVIPYISPNTIKYTKTKDAYTINADTNNCLIFILCLSDLLW